MHGTVLWGNSPLLFYSSHKERTELRYFYCREQKEEEIIFQNSASQEWKMCSGNRFVNVKIHGSPFWSYNVPVTSRCVSPLLDTSFCFLLNWPRVLHSKFYKRRYYSSTVVGVVCQNATYTHSKEIILIVLKCPINCIIVIGCTNLLFAICLSYSVPRAPKNGYRKPRATRIE